MKKVLNIVVLFIGITLYASDFTGTGFGPTMSEAKSEALADLSQSIKAEITSIFQKNQFESNTGKSGSFTKSSVQVSSNLPIIGAEFEMFTNDKTIEALVKLLPSKAKPLYTQKIRDLLIEIETLHANSKKTQIGIEQQKILTLLLNKLNEFDRYKSVAIAIGMNEIQEPSVRKADIKTRLITLESNIDSLEVASTILAKSFSKYKNIYIYPVKTVQSHEITPFSSALKSLLSSKLKTSLLPADASYWLVGEYTQMDNGMVLSYALIDTLKRENIEASALSIPSKAYKGLRTQPNSMSFDKLLHQGVVLSDKLKVSINTNKGNNELLFKSGEEIQLMTKMNKMGYFYVVGYTQTNEGKHAYLLELEESPGDTKFVKFVNADDANKWIDLGTFIVDAPYGIESLQIIASNKKFKHLPKHQYDENTGYYLIGNSLEKSIIQTRGLHKKISKDKKAVVSEAVLMFTTMEE